MKLYASWFVFRLAPSTVYRHFEYRRVTSMAQLATVTRKLREAMEARTAV